jgi:hypothetical protein
MSLGIYRLNEQEQLSLRVSLAFLSGRLKEVSTLNWALSLIQDIEIKRQAIAGLLTRSDASELTEPWRKAWRLVEESWRSQPLQQNSANEYLIRRRLNAGERSGSVLNAIVDLVRPQLEVKPFSAFHLRTVKTRRRPREVSDIFFVTLTSGTLDDPLVLGIGELDDVLFLTSLGNALDAAVIEGLDIGRRIGWDGKRRSWTLGLLKRVYYVAAGNLPHGENEPDRYHTGIAPSVKLLSMVVTRLLELDPSLGKRFVDRWKLRDSPIHKRLWAAFSRYSEVTDAEELAQWLTALDDREFWDLFGYPEVFEVRAIRFREFGLELQHVFLERIVKGPPRSQWPKNVTKKVFEEARLYWVARELKRLQIAGAELPEGIRVWFESLLARFADLARMSSTTYGFWGSAKAEWVAPSPDIRFDSLFGLQRLRSLESALALTRQSRDDNPAGGAADWIRQGGNTTKLIDDLESTSDAGAAYPLVWDQLGWAQKPEENAEVAQDAGALQQAQRMLALLLRLPSETLAKGIEGISHWLSSWEHSLMGQDAAWALWFKLWPIAVAVTNSRKSEGGPTDLNTVAQSTDHREPQDLDTLNTPAGRLVGSFIAACYEIGRDKARFQESPVLRAMRDQIMQATGRSKLIAQHRMIETLEYFLAMDTEWTQSNLLEPLSTGEPDTLALWRALARRTQFFDVLRFIGEQMVLRAVDLRLGRETRQSLVFSIVVESLRAYLDGRDPAVNHEKVQQMLRSVEDELRAYGAGAIQRFVVEVAAKTSDQPVPLSAAGVFRVAASPFLTQVWPKERSLTTPGVARALADLPATAQEAFAEAVEVIDRFLVPFDCWSLLDFGLHGEMAGVAKLAVIDDTTKAAAFLRLLDRTIGTSETATIPYDLGDALTQISSVAPSVTSSGAFRRLATAARRV